MYNYLLSSEITSMKICVWTSGWRLSTTLNLPIDFISLTGCINEGLTLIFSISSNKLAISVGFTDPYSSLFSVASFLTLYSFFWILSGIHYLSLLEWILNLSSVCLDMEESCSNMEGCTGETLLPLRQRLG